MKKKIEDIIIVGGGPAGSYLGWLLAKNGLHPIIFDHSHPREKPCGGGISVLALEKFPFLNDVPEPKNLDFDFGLISPTGISVMTSGKKGSWSLSRLILDKYILDKAIEYGCRLIPERVINVKIKENVWHIKTREAEYQAKIIIGADGVNSIVRKKILGPIPKEHLGLCYGCFATSDKKEPTSVKFLKNKQGYAWCFPRHDHLSIGVGTSSLKTKDIKKIFKEFQTTYYPKIKILSTWGATIPNIKNDDFFKLPCSGENWILIGDAAGHVDSATGEGITYALWSAELAAKAIIENDPKSFDRLWRNAYGNMLAESCKMREIFYNPFLLEYTIRLANKSKTLSTLLYEFMTNQIPSKDLMKRIIRDIPKTMKEYLEMKLS
ncbi:MAG: NAD(P)/FAD-dependent oxidoreductase [Candidatus Thermoplasmatota archaeon]|nr:NAD(P)/FAD-dependent oxidoreductase [Candidatus Thermoplasmatota archaeon]